MPTVFHTQPVEADVHALWKILSDLPRYKEWLVLPAGRVTGVKVTADAGVLTRSERRVEVEGGQWFEERVTEASAPGYVAFQVVRDNTGKFASTYKDLSYTIKAVPTASGGVNVTMNVAYTKASFIGRWTDFFGPRSWRQAFKRSLERLAALAHKEPKPELFTPTWRQPSAPEPAATPAAPAAPVEPPRPVEDRPAPPPAPAEAFAAAESAASPEAETAEVEFSRAELEEQLTLLRGMLVQARQVKLPTADIEARIAQIEAKLGQ